MYQVSIHVCGLELIVKYCGRYCRANPRLLGVIVYWNCAIWRFFCPIYRLVTSKEKLPHHDTMVFHAIILIVMMGYEKEKIYIHSCFTYISVTMGIICKLETTMVYIIYLYYWYKWNWRRIAFVLKMLSFFMQTTL